VRLRLISEHTPELEGTASGRLLRATADGLLAEGHDVTAVCWTDRAPSEQLPAWAQWRPLRLGHGLREHLQALVRPRGASRGLGLVASDVDVEVAEDMLSYAAVDHLRPNAVVVHYSNRLDARSLGRVGLSDVQGHRADRRAVRRATVPLAYSARVAAELGERAAVVPAAVAVPSEALTLTDRPVALLLAGWDWGPNRAALSTLLTEWPSLRRQVAGAELLVAGRGAPDVSAAGVRVVGAVARSADAFAEAALLAFPCPRSSGPKVKVLEAMAAGLPVVTTPAGVEGLADGVSGAAVVVELPQFATALAAVLRDSTQRTELAARGRAAVVRHHAPRVAAAARIAALRAGLS
jgi:glycosyltransferase involved in cell wall biosynthesis